jgi:hypothetical protein
MIVPAVSISGQCSLSRTDARPKQSCNFVGMVIVASGKSYGATFFGYLINAATWGLWPVVSTPFQSTLHLANYLAAICMGERDLSR